MKASQTLNRPVRVYEALIAALVLAIAVGVVGLLIDRGTDVVSTTDAAPTTTSDTQQAAIQRGRAADAARLQAAADAAQVQGQTIGTQTLIGGGITALHGWEAGIAFGLQAADPQPAGHGWEAGTVSTSAEEAGTPGKPLP